MMKQITTAFALLILSITFASAGKLIPFKDPKTQLHGFKNEKGTIVVPAQFQIVSEPKKDELLIPVVKDGTYYLMDRNGTLKFESVFYDNGWDYYAEGVARFLKDGKVGFHDKQGNIVIQPQYDFAKYFDKGLSVVCNGCWAYYPKSPKYRPLSSGHYITLQEEYREVTGGKWGVINIKGEVIVPLTYDTMEAVLKTLDHTQSPQNHVYEFLKGAELQCEDEQRAEVRRLLNDLLLLPPEEIKKKRYNNYTGKPEWTAHYFAERHFVPDGGKFLNEDTFYEELADPRVKESIRSFLRKCE